MAAMRGIVGGKDSSAVAEALRLAEAIESLLTDAHSAPEHSAPEPSTPEAGFSLRLALGLARNLKDELAVAVRRRP